MAVLFWNESNIHIYQGSQLLFELNTSGYSPFDASSVSAEIIHFVEFKDKCRFLAIALSNGYLLTFNFYPEIFEKLQKMSKIDPSFKLDVNLKETLLKFSQMFKLGDFIVKMTESLILNSSGELIELRPVRNQSNSGYRLQSANISLV